MLQHVALETAPADVEACVAFWRLLGFARVPEPATLSGRATWLERGATQIHLLHSEHPAIPPRGHCAVVAADYPATLARLAAAGHPTEARRQHWGAPRAYVTSPGGHRVELMAAPPRPGAQDPARPA